MALVRRTANASSRTVHQIAQFDGDGVTNEFVIDDPKRIAIASVFVGGQMYREGENYTKDNDAKAIMILGDAIPAGVGIDVVYFSDVSISALTLANLTPDQLATLAEALGPYLL